MDRKSFLRTLRLIKSAVLVIEFSILGSIAALCGGPWQMSFKRFLLVLFAICSSFMAGLVGGLTQAALIGEKHAENKKRVG